MTLGRLKELLDDLLLPDTTPVRIMSQPNYPFECHLRGIALSEDIATRTDAPKPDVIYLVEGEQIGYGDKEAWEVYTR